VNKTMFLLVRTRKLCSFFVASIDYKVHVTYFPRVRKRKGPC